MSEKVPKVPENFDEDVLELDFTNINSLASPLDKNLKKKYDSRKFDRLIIKTKYLQKQYDKNFNLISIEPFFVDISLHNKYNDYKILETYYTAGAKVNILEVEDIIENLYEIQIPEFKFNIEMLKYVYKKVKLYEETGITDDPIITRWYKEFGILEYLMKDKKILEININPPGYKTPIRVIHEDYGECVTNIFPSVNFLNYFLTRLKMHSGRPLNKVSPELDTEIEIEGVKGRIAAIVDPFSIFGPGFSIRKHRENPWTLELFIKNKTLNSLFAGFMSFVIANGRSYLFAGPRGSGKTSLMTSSLLEIPTNNRLITIEDTQEIPIKVFKDLGYDLLPLKVRSSLMEEGMEIDFEKGLRTTLRLGDSCLILGEIRGEEAKVLFEAMRVGAISNVVTGTIHADTAYGVYDRIVNDLKVTKGSFKALDLIILVNYIKDLSGSKKLRRITEVVEVLKDWKEEPKFLTLFKYDSKTDNILPTKEFLNGESQIFKSILSRSKSYKTYNDIIKDILIRMKIKDLVIKNVKDKNLLEAEFTKRYNTIFLKEYNKLESLDDFEEIKKIILTFKKKLLNIIKENSKNDKNL